MNAKQRRKAYKAQYRTHGEEATQIYVTARVLGEAAVRIPYRGHPDRIWRSLTVGLLSPALCIRELCRELRRRDEYEAQYQALCAPEKITRTRKDHPSGL